MILLRIIKLSDYFCAQLLRKNITQGLHWHQSDKRNQLTLTINPSMD
jgi:hypothetical protein